MHENVKNPDTIRMRLANEKSGFQFVTKLPNKTFILGSLLKDNVWMGYIIASWRQLACIDNSNGTKKQTHTLASTNGHELFAFHVTFYLASGLSCRLCVKITATIFSLPLQSLPTIRWYRFCNVTWFRYLILHLSIIWCQKMCIFCFSLFRAHRTRSLTLSAWCNINNKSAMVFIRERAYHVATRRLADTAYIVIHV